MNGILDKLESIRGSHDPGGKVRRSLAADVEGYVEVGKRSRYEWEQTILKTFEIWRKVQTHGGGWVHFDRKARSVEFSIDKPQA